MAVAETFVLKKAVSFGGLTVFKALKTGFICLAFLGILYCIWATVIQPHTKWRIKTTEQITERGDIKNISIKRDKVLGIGVEVFGWKLGFYKDYQDTIPAITQ